MGLTLNDRCDARCSAAAEVRYDVPMTRTPHADLIVATGQTLPLDLCGHHSRKHAVGLIAAGATPSIDNRTWKG